MPLFVFPYRLSQGLSRDTKRGLFFSCHVRRVARKEKMKAILYRLLPLALTSALAVNVSHADIVNILDGSTSGYAMSDGNTYSIDSSASFSNTEVGGNGITIDENAVVVIYIPTNNTLTAVGSNGSRQTGGGAGIYVPASSTLIITGEGSLVATGGNAGDGESGQSGGKGSQPSYHSGNYPYKVGGTQKAYGWAAKGSSGAGGAGGAGGGGAGAGIGGNGGRGGSGGTGGSALSINSYVLDSGFCTSGTNGASGDSAADGSAMGNVYILGSVKVIARHTMC